jgi:hypothetical protein
VNNSQRRRPRQVKRKQQLSSEINEVSVEDLLQLQKYQACNCRNVSGNAEACPVHSGLKFTVETFEEWWTRDGKFYDPDTEDVPWFDKRKLLAEYAFEHAKSQTGERISKIETADILTNVCQIIDVVKIEWGEAWSAWDQAVRDSISLWLKRFHGLK